MAVLGNFYFPGTTAVFNITQIRKKLMKITKKRNLNVSILGSLLS